MTVMDVLPIPQFKSLQMTSRLVHYIPTAMGHGGIIHLSHVPRHLNKALTVAMERAWGVQLADLGSFLRLNSSRHDTTLRIHSDSVIRGKRPSHAAVFYLDTCPDSGTALFRHPEFGDRDAAGAIFTEDDGKWELYHLTTEVENSMFTYKPELFHGRHPWTARGNTRKDGRVVVVKFMKEIQ